MERKLELEENILDEKIIEKAEKKLEEEIDKLITEKKPINSLVFTLRRGVLRSEQFLRLIKVRLYEMCSWYRFIKNVEPYMRKYL